MTDEMGKVVDDLIEKREEEEKEENMVREVTLTEVENLKIQNIFLRQQILQEQLNAIRKELELLAGTIKVRTGSPPDAEVGFDPNNLSIVRIGRLSNVRDSTS